MARLAPAEPGDGRDLPGDREPAPRKLADALRRLAVAAENVAARYVVVDAIDDRAAAFYEAHGFSRLPDGTRLVRKMSAVASDLIRQA